jgi:hypothetical protein
MPASFVSRQRGRAIVMALGLLSLECWEADASPIFTVSPGEDGAAVDLRFERSMPAVGESARWDVPTSAQVAVLGRGAEPMHSSAAQGLAGTALVGSLSFPGAAGDLASQPGLATLPERASRETLKDVLRSLATVHRVELRPPPAAPATRRAAAAANTDVDEDVNEVQSAGLAELLLDSEIAGAMLRSLVTIKSTDSDGTTFAVLGSGDFVLDVSPAAHAAHIMELSSGVSFGTASGYSVYSDYTASGGGGQVVRRRVNLVHVIWEWCLDTLSGPAGVLLSTITMIVLFFWGCVKAVGMAQRRGGRSDGGASTRLR